jgi:hypothetical protein
VEYRLRRLGRADLARQDQRIGERAHSEAGQQRPRVLRAVADDRDLDTAGPEPFEKRDGVVEEPRGRVQQFPVLIYERADQGRPRLDAALGHDAREALRLRQPSGAQLIVDAPVSRLPGIGRDAGEDGELAPEGREVAA